jgi:hypothetical protein
LKLCLALLWEPVNPHLLLQFLIHPLGPVRGDVRRVLAGAVAAEPGIGGRAWEEAIAGLESRLAESGNSPAELRAVREAIAEFFESQRYEPEAGAPVEALYARAHQVGGWLGRRLGAVEDPGARAMFGGALAQVETLLGALKSLAEQGRTTLGRIELEKLVDEVSREQPDPEIFAEVGRVRASSHPGNITGTWRQVFWWDLAPERRDVTYPWSSAELAALNEAGASLPAVESLLADRSRAWLRPVINCRERCVLIVHHDEAGQHPLWSQIDNLVEALPVLDLDIALLEGTAEQLPYLGVVLHSLTLQPLPGIRRWWELPGEAQMPARTEESYSSLNKLFHYPHEWVLNYPARLRPGRAEDLMDGPRLYGTLAHRLFENFFTAHDDWRALDETRIDAWIADALPRLIRAEGAVLLEPGRGVDLEQVSAVLERALPRLVEHLIDANIVSVRAEHAEAAPYGRGETDVRGVIDLLLTGADGEEIVVDTKWGGEKIRGQEIEQNRHLQLASYAYMRKQVTGSNRWPYQAYFIVSSGSLLAPDSDIFPQAQVWAPSGGVDVAALWSRGEQTYAWRRDQLDQGLVEVNTRSAEPTSRSEPPEDGLDTLVEPDRFDDYTTLTGWDEFA